MLAWLKATIRGDLAAAKLAQPGPWHIGNAVDPTGTCNLHTFPGASGVADNLRWLDAEYLVRQDPRDTIARREADLAILEEHKPGRYGECVICDIGAQSCGCCGWGEFPCNTVSNLASGYRHREGYLAKWSPEATS
jgi:hypothetical protein